MRAASGGLKAELKRKDKVIEALFQQIDALTDRIASDEAAISRLLGQKQDLFQAIRKRQQVIEDQAKELQAAREKRRPSRARVM
jgi:peptidoglycan hydrolase CwlO-like protein